MKRVFAVLLCAVMLLSMAGCADKEELALQAEQAQKYQKYAELIETLEQANYKDALHKVAMLEHQAQLANQGDRPETVQLLSREWTLYAESDYNYTSPTQLSFNADGSCSVNGTSMTWIEQGSNDSSIEGLILDNGENSFYFYFNANREAPSRSSLQLNLVESTEWGLTSGDHIATYIAHPYAPQVMASWRLLDGDDTMPESFYIDRYNMSCSDLSFTWDITSAVDDSTVAVHATALNGYTQEYSLVMQERDGHYVMTLTDDATGASALYYCDQYGYEASWPEYLYPRALEWVKGYVNSNYFWTSDRSYSDNEALVFLHQKFTELGDYKDSADYLSRFTVLPSQLTSVVQISTDQLGNESKNTLGSYTYDASGKRVTARGEEIVEFTGVYSSGTPQQFTYDASGRISSITLGWVNGSVEGIGTPNYDAEGKLLSTDVQTTSWSYTSTFTYDDQGRVASISVPQNYYEEPRTFTYSYTDGGLLAQKVHTWNDSYYTLTSDYTYENGVLVRVDATRSYRYGDPYTTTYVYTNDDQGRPVTVDITTTDPNNTYKAMRCEYTYEDLYFFDSTGLTAED